MLKNRQFPMIAVYSLAAMLLASCITVYRSDVQQGNVVTEEMVEKLKMGMNRSQVRFVLGTPLLTDPFHSDRWDYYYFLKKGGEAEAVFRRVTVIFDQDRLVKVDGDIKATGLEETAGPDPRGVGKSEEPDQGGDASEAPYPSSG